MVPIIFSVLQQIAELDYWTLCPAPQAQGDDSDYPPRVLWRHVAPSPELAIFLQEAVQTFSGKTRWELIITERNWLLWPARIMEHARANHLPNGRKAAADLKKIDPEFGKLSNAELHLLAEHIAKAAAKLSAT